jgi:DNA-binding GntR family transcriptional regulator
MYAEPGVTVSGLCNAFHVSRFTILRQINALEDENLMRRERVGKTKRLFIESRAFSLLANGWLRRMSLSEYESTSLKED